MNLETVTGLLLTEYLQVHHAASNYPRTYNILIVHDIYRCESVLLQIPLFRVFVLYRDKVSSEKACLDSPAFPKLSSCLR